MASAPLPFGPILGSNHLRLQVAAFRHPLNEVTLQPLVISQLRPVFRFCGADRRKG